MGGGGGIPLLLGPQMRDSHILICENDSKATATELSLSKRSPGGGEKRYTDSPPQKGPTDTRIKEFGNEGKYLARGQQL